MGISTCCTPLLKSLSYMVVITGLILLSLATWLLLFKGYFIPLLHNPIYTYCIFLVVASGVLHITTGFLISSLFHSRCSLFFYILIILTSIVLDGALGYFTISYQSTSSQELQETLKSDMITKFSIDPIITYAVDNLQKNGKCCGSRAFNDYPQKSEPKKYTDEYPVKRVQYIPDSCCQSFGKNCALSDNPSNIYYMGCLTYIQQEVHHNLKFIFIITATSLIILLLTFVTSFTACCRNDENNQRGSQNNNNLLSSKHRDQELFLID